MKKVITVLALLALSCVAQAGTQFHYTNQSICGQSIRLMYDRSGHIIRYYFHDNDGYTSTGLMAGIKEGLVVLVIDDCDRFDVVAVPNELIYRMEVETKYPVYTGF